MSIEDEIQDRFKCQKCGHTECHSRELAMTGTGFSKLFDVQNNYFLFVSCDHCGHTDVFDSDIVKGKRGAGIDVLDFFFGG